MPPLRRTIFRPSMATIALLLCSGSLASPAQAVPLSLFRYEDLAQLHCPNDKVIWLDLRKGRYYAKGQKLYARGLDGTYACQEEARGSGYRRSLTGRR